MAEETEQSTSENEAHNAPASSAMSVESALAGDVDDANDLDDDDVEADEAMAEGPRPLIFISYQHGADQPIVSSLRQLLERAITPSPEVFVASEGGIKPSAHNYKIQLQDAVRRAAVFIGVISKTSKDREWLHFEAGAAWGLRRMYAPLLIETSAIELGTTIDDYQATNAYNIDQVRRLLDSIAIEIRARLRPQFGKRYSSFARSLRGHSTAATKVPQGTFTLDDQIAHIVALRSSGKTADADALVAQLEADAVNIQAKARIRIQLIIKTYKKPHELLSELERLPVEYTQIPLYIFARGIWEDSSELRFRYLRAVIEHSEADDALRREALAALIDDLYEARQDIEATARVYDSLSSKDRMLRQEVAVVWCKHMTKDEPLLRLLLAGFGYRSYPSQELLMQQIEISLEQKWFSLAVHYADSIDVEWKEGTAANERGRVYQLTSLPSLAYEAYQKAVSLGASVARCNIANMVTEGGVAAIGIQLLDQHQGPFDSVSPAYPYRTRATLEEKVHQEKARRDRLRKHGWILNTLLVDLIELAIQSRQILAKATYVIDNQQFQVKSNKFNLTLEAVVLPEIVSPPAPSALASVSARAVAAIAKELDSQIRVLVLRRICTHLPIWETTVQERKCILTLDDKGALVGISLKSLSDDGSDPVRIRFEGADKT